MSDKVTMTEEEFEARLNDTHFSGVSSGLASAAGLLMVKAQDYFKRNEDKTAQLLRQTARELEEKSRAATLMRAKK